MRKDYYYIFLGIMNGAIIHGEGFIVYKEKNTAIFLSDTVDHKNPFYFILDIVVFTCDTA